MALPDSAPVSAEYAPRIPVALSSTLAPLARGPLEPTFRFTADGVWLTARTPLGAATLHLTQRASAVAAMAWGPGAEWMIDGVPRLLGHDDDWSALDVAGHPLLQDSLRRNPGLRLLRTSRVFEAMAPAIFEQKVTGKEARSSWRVLVGRHGEPAPGPAPSGMRLIPTPEVWRRIPSWEWHRAGVGPDRSAAVMRAATVAPSLERTLTLGRGGAAVERALCSIPGIGAWTAAETMQRAHGDPDSPSFGDYHLPALVGWALTGAPVDDDGMLSLLEPWAGQRQRVMRLIECSGFAKPRFGPRMTVQDHRAH